MEVYGLEKTCGEIRGVFHTYIDSAWPGYADRSTVKIKNWRY